MSTNSRTLNVGAVADTGLIDCEVFDYDRNSEETQVLKAGGVIQAPAEGKLQFARPEKPRQEEKLKRLEERRREMERRQRPTKEQRNVQK